MAEVKWIKIYTNMINNKKIKRIRKMPSGNDIILIWVFLISQAGECNKDGALLLSEAIPFAAEDLAIEFDFSLDVIKLALIALEKFGMIEVFEAVIYIKNWEEYQNVEGLEKIRQQDAKRSQTYRDRKKVKKQLLLQENTSCDPSRDGHDQITVNHATDIDLDKDLDRERERERILEITIEKLWIDMPEMNHHDLNNALKKLSEANDVKNPLAWLKRVIKGEIKNRVISEVTKK